MVKEIVMQILTKNKFYHTINIMNDLDKYEVVHNWLINELDSTIAKHPNKEVVSWLKMLKESYLYNLSKFE